MLNREQIKARLAHPSLWDKWVTVVMVNGKSEAIFPIKGGPFSAMQIDKRDPLAEGKYELR